MLKYEGVFPIKVEGLHHQSISRLMSNPRACKRLTPNFLGKTKQVINLTNTTESGLFPQDNTDRGGGQLIDNTRL